MTEHERPVNEDEITAFIDGRLPDVRQQAMTRYLAQNPAVQARVSADKAATQSLRQRLGPIAEQPVPDRLRVDTILRRQREVRTGRIRIAVACVLLLATGTATGWVAHDFIPLRSVSVRLPDPSIQANLSIQADLSTTTTDAISAHRIYVVEKAHPVEVGATQEAHLVQWLSRRLGHPLTAPNLVGQGYVLMGGRLLPAANEAAAQFMYQDQAGHRLTVYVRAVAGEDTRFRFVGSRDVSAFSWIDQGLGFAIVGTVDRPGLLGIADSVYEQLDPQHRTAPADL